MPRVDAARLDPLLRVALAGDPGPLAAFLREHSNLPGPRGNLELAGQFAAAVADLAMEAPEPCWQVVSGLAEVGADQAPTGDPGEFLAFCGTLAAAGFAADPRRGPAVWEVLRRAAEDERWRLREAAAQAIPPVARIDRAGTLQVLEDWAARGPWLLCRAAAAGLADPPLLQDADWAGAALRLHQAILARFIAASDRRDAAYKVLRKGLGYTLSVVVAAAPGEGFALLRRLAGTADRDLARVLRSNLARGRLRRAHALEVESILSLLAG